ncbi:MAG TPA: hypothetical protein VMT52_12180, partial [Planctomycetota bacterium]|nr:hypothetical protein [Planctomycetota bacterium]
MRAHLRNHRVLRCGIVAAILSLGLGSPRGVQAGFDDNGWIVDWLVYGPLLQSAGPTPSLE